MNTLLGERIRSLRLSKGFTQEQISEKMHCTRQKYARIEKGLVDISYTNLNVIAQILNIEVEQITSVVDDVEQSISMFRTTENSSATDQFEKMIEMIDTFYAHRKLYIGMRQEDIDEEE